MTREGEARFPAEECKADLLTDACQDQDRGTEANSPELAPLTNKGVVTVVTKLNGSLGILAGFQHVSTADFCGFSN